VNAFPCPISVGPEPLSGLVPPPSSAFLGHQKVGSPTTMQKLTPDHRTQNPGVPSDRELLPISGDGHVKGCADPAPERTASALPSRDSEWAHHFIDTRALRKVRPSGARQLARDDLAHRYKYPREQPDRPPLTQAVPRRRRAPVQFTRSTRCDRLNALSQPKRGPARACQPGRDRRLARRPAAET
jgi:hypothetical protein